MPPFFNHAQHSSKVLIKDIYRECHLKNKEIPISQVRRALNNPCRLYVILMTVFAWTFSTPEFAEDVWEQHNASLVQHTNTCHCSERHEQSITRCNVQPDREERHSEEVVEEDHGLPNYARQKSNRSVNALSASLEVPEAPLLKSSELRICTMSVILICAPAT
jgi:hypothetical protein